MSDVIPENNERRIVFPGAQDAMQAAFDLTRQCIVIAIGCIGFAVWLSYAAPSLLSTWIFWTILCLFGCSIACGLLFFMQGIYQLHSDRAYDLNAFDLRKFSIGQILLTAAGVALLCLFLRCPVESANGTIQVKTGDTTLVYPYESGKSHIVEIENGKVTFSSGSSE